MTCNDEMYHEIQAKYFRRKEARNQHRPRVRDEAKINAESHEECANAARNGRERSPALERYLELL